MKNEQMSLNKFDSQTDVASCHICHACNHKSVLPDAPSDRVVDHLYRLKFGQSVVILCDNCLKQLSSMINASQKLSTQLTPPSNDPLTIEELEEMYNGDNSFVWVVYGVAVLPAILDYYNGELVAVWCADAESMLHEKNYGTTWLAYTSKPTLD